MNYLLDTHTFLWWLEDNPELSKAAKQIINNSNNTIFFSSASSWEITIKKSLGKLQAPDNLEEVIASNHFTILPISVAHTIKIGALPHHHDDPFDRLLIAQAQHENLIFITRDSKIAIYDIKIVKA